MTPGKLGVLSMEQRILKMLVKTSVATILAPVAVLLAMAVQPASAQQSCGAMYNRMINAYQESGPSSPRYAEMFNRYTARCTARPASVRRPFAGSGGGCEELRLACLNKDRLGEQGEGNCRRYREMCRP